MHLHLVNDAIRVVSAVVSFALVLLSLWSLQHARSRPVRIPGEVKLLVGICLFAALASIRPVIFLAEGRPPNWQLICTELLADLFCLAGLRDRANTLFHIGEQSTPATRRTRHGAQ